MQDLTTQKHDYVVKNVERPQKCVPCGQIIRTCEPLEKETVHRLSFAAPNPENARCQSFKPTTNYQQPSGRPFRTYIFLIFFDNID